MPICCDPKATVPFSLDRDKAAPEAKRPAFLCKHLTRREVRAIDRIWVGLKDRTMEEFYAGCQKIIAIGIVGWQNFVEPPTDADGNPNPLAGKPMPFSVEAIDAQISDGEYVTLASTFPLAVALAEGDRKNSDSPEQSGAGVAEIATDAATPQTSAPPIGTKASE